MNERKVSSNRKQLDSSQIGWTGPLLIACLTVAASASFSFGYGIGAPNMYAQFTEPFLRKQFDVCDVENQLVRQEYNCSPLVVERKGGMDLRRELINGLPQTVFIIGCFVGSLTGLMWYSIGPWWTRRNVFLINMPFTYIAAACMLASYHFRFVALFFLSRLLHGYQSGMACCIVPPYINEISSQKVRGGAGVFHQFFITVGILVAQLVGLPFMLARYQYWSLGLSLMAVPCLIANVLIFWLPDSPSEMMIKFGNAEKATKSLRKLRKVEDVSVELDELKAQAGSSRDAGTSISVAQLFTRKNLRWQTVTSMTLLTVQALSGVNAVFFYSSKIFRTAGIKDEYLLYANAITGMINVIVTVAVIPLIERMGRRPLIIYPMCAMLMALAALTLFIQLNDTLHSIYLGWGSVLFTLLFICAYALSLGAIAFIYPNEVFRQEARDTALRVGMCLNYAGNLFLSLCFPAVNAALKGYVFVIFFVISLIALIVLWWKMPETKNKSIEEIERFWYAKVQEDSDDKQLTAKLQPTKRE